MSPRNLDFTDFIYLGAHARVPAHVPAPQVYGFGPMDPGDLATHMANGRVTASILRAGQGLPPLGVGAVAQPAAPAPPLAAPAVVPPPQFLEAEWWRFLLRWIQAGRSDM